MLPLIPPRPGLSRTEAQRLRQHTHDWRMRGVSVWSYAVTVLRIIVTPLNIIILTLAGLLWWLGAHHDAVITAVVVCINMFVSVFQSVRAQALLNAISLASAPVAVVWRESELVSCHPNDVVVGDVVLLRPADQVVAEGVVLASEHLRVDESMYTGEDEAVVLSDGAQVRAGSTCVSGAAWYCVTSNQHTLQMMTAGAQQMRTVRTPLSDMIQRNMSVLLVIATVMIILVTLRDAWYGETLLVRIQNATVMAGLIPNALVLALTLCYAAAAIAMTRADVLVQQLPAVEALASVDVICLDKTGTITTNNLTLHAVLPIATNEHTCRVALARFVRADIAGNRTSEAIRVALQQVETPHVPLLAHVPFDSQRKWSMQVTASDTWVLGAPDIIAKQFDAEWKSDVEVDNAVAQGARVLMLAHCAGVTHIDETHPQLPPRLQPYGVVILYDQIRDGAAETITIARAAGIQVYVISGDDPHAVATLAKRVGIESATAVHGADFGLADTTRRQALVQQMRVFGRTSPTDKADIIAMLQTNGQRVAMIGDGYNDIPALKTADVAVVLQSARSAVRNIADVVLLSDDLNGLLALRKYGQHITIRMTAVLQHFLVRVVLSACCLFVGLLVGTVIWTPFDSAMLALWGVAIPSILLIVMPNITIPPWFIDTQITVRMLSVLATISAVFVIVSWFGWPHLTSTITWWWCMCVLWSRIIVVMCQKNTV
jgi:cation-transporting ATPase E